VLPVSGCHELVNNQQKTKESEITRESKSPPCFQERIMNRIEYPRIGNFADGIPGIGLPKTLAFCNTEPSQIINLTVRGGDWKEKGTYPPVKKNAED
jgi:hypothetical protein